MADVSFIEADARDLRELILHDIPAPHGQTRVANEMRA